MKEDVSEIDDEKMIIPRKIFFLSCAREGSMVRQSCANSGHYNAGKRENDHPWQIDEAM
jgi:hypothetical protein